MKISGNTILITGGGSGIGRGLAEALAGEGNRIIIAGRRQSVLDEVVKANAGMKALALDIESAGGVRSFAAEVSRLFPALNVLINNAGIMRGENLLSQPNELKDAEAIINTNLLGPVRLTAALMPLLKKQPNATIINVSSGLAFVPMATTPTYSATKAAIHSYTESLRYQLKDTAIEVLELIPPYVATELQGERQAKDPNAMPLDAYIKETIEILKAHPEATEICVRRVDPLRRAAERGNYAVVFKGLNDSVAASHVAK